MYAINRPLLLFAVRGRGKLIPAFERLVETVTIKGHRANICSASCIDADADPLAGQL